MIEHDPFALVEAMTIAGLATGCEHAYVYLRGEYPLAWGRLSGAIDEARARGLLGDDVMGAGVAFDIELRKGAGAYICGEETALFNSIEGYRGEPRSKPPFPVDSGLFSKPTVVNNVESLINVLDIVHRGRCGVRRDRDRAVDRHAPLLPLRMRRAPRPVRGAVRRHAGRAARDGGRRRRRAAAARGAARRRGRRVRRAGLARPRALVRGHPRRRRDAGLGRRHGLRRHGRPRRRSCSGSPPSSATSPAASACRAGSGPSASRRRSCGSRPSGRAGRSPTRWRCSTRSRGPCATPRSAASARRPPTRSTRPIRVLARLRAGGRRDERRPRRRSAAPSSSRSTARRCASPRARRSSTPARRAGSTSRRSATARR